MLVRGMGKVGAREELVGRAQGFWRSHVYSELSQLKAHLDCRIHMPGSTGDIFFKVVIVSSPVK